MTESVAFDLARTVLNSTGRVRIRAIGTSMLPSIWPGDELEIQRVFGPLLTGNVVAFVRDERLFIHRVISVSPDQNTILTQGDRLAVPDAAIERGQLLGIVSGMARSGVPVPLSAHMSLGARLLRGVSRFSEWPAFLLLKARQRS